MYRVNPKEALAVEGHMKGVFESPLVQARAKAIGRLFAEELDFQPADRRISLANARGAVILPEDAHHVASLDTAHVVYVALDIRDTDRVRKAEAAEAARLISNQLDGDLLLVFTNTSISQLHLIYPTFEGKRPTLRRMVVERYLPRRTAIQQIANIYHQWQEKESIHIALESAFDVEAVTKHFFIEYKRVFDAAMEKIKGFGQSQEEDKRLYVQTLFNRLMFVYFLSRKGWLTFRGDMDYLNALWNDYRFQDDRTNFYTDRLDLLFFSGLNNPQSQDLNYKNEVLNFLIGPVPFLNGGLFDTTDLDKRDGIVVPDSAIEPILTQLFDRFNFTVMESTPFDIEVAVDPEMLGKVFEELVTGRHESGSYYTPRPVVAFMCREALKGYLAGEDTGLSDEAIASFVDIHDTSGISITGARQLAAALEEITVVDPACGSGAYLLGMMQELIELQTALFSEQLLAGPQSLYDLKLRIIERNLYGVDIDPFATNIAMLRLWLALAIEYEGERPQPLPNLDFKIVCGDSLLGPDPDPENLGDLFKNKAHEVAQQLADLKADHMKATGGYKDSIRAKIESVQNELRRVLVAMPAPGGSVDWRVEFAEVFDRRGGFDIVVANPPYVRQEELSSLKAALGGLYPEVYTGTADILVYFYARAVQLLRPDALLAFITSNTFTNRKYGKKIRDLLAKHLTIQTVIDFGEAKIFDATVEAFILVGSASSPVPNSIVKGHNLFPLLSRKLGRSSNAERVRKEMTRLSEHLEAEVSFFPQSRLGEAEWRIEDEDINRLFKRLMTQGTPLGEFAKWHIYMGVKTGLNEAFVIDQSKRDELISEDPRSVDLIKPWLRGRDIKRWRALWNNQYVIAIQNSDDADAKNPWGSEVSERNARATFRSLYPAIHNHLSFFEKYYDKNGNERSIRDRQDQGKFWWELRSCTYYSQFAHPKIVWPDISREVRFAFDTNGYYANNKCYIMPINSMWMLAMMNSELAEFLLCQITSALRGGFLQLNYQYTIRLPVAIPGSSQQHQLASIARAGFIGEPVDNDELNNMVYCLYGLSDSDIMLIKNWFERRSLVAG
ncbi:MAG: Eco57I restriction-modification methylase domain-containing protein [Caldilineaceae bacterium]|nr:Eco57I restriction-modification methylase domain-containing protein [Caldilineaceae bacterium]